MLFFFFIISFPRRCRNIHGKIITDGGYHGTYKFQENEQVVFHRWSTTTGVAVVVFGGGGGRSGGGGGE